jgi:hypothetical protein
LHLNPDELEEDNYVEIWHGLKWVLVEQGIMKFE